MAERRMFTMKIVDSDAFLEMPMSTQSLYFHLNMRADDDGFVNNPKRIQRMIGASEDDLKILLAKRFILGFENGIVVIKHWRMHNLLRKDRYNPTQYIEEKATLTIKDDGAYTEKAPIECLATTWQPHDNQMATEDRLGKDRLGKVSIGESISDSANPQPNPTQTKSQTKSKTKSVKHKKGEYGHVLLTDEQEEKLIDEYGGIVAVKAITFLDEYIEMKGYKAKNHYLAIKKWVMDAVMEREQKSKAGKIGNSFETDDLFNAALQRSFRETGVEAEKPKTAADDEGIRAKMEALKERIGQG